MKVCCLSESECHRFAFPSGEETLINIRSMMIGRGPYLNSYFENRQQNTRMSRIYSFLSSVISSTMVKVSPRGYSGVDRRGGATGSWPLIVPWPYQLTRRGTRPAVKNLHSPQLAFVKTGQNSWQYGRIYWRLLLDLCQNEFL